MTDTVALTFGGQRIRVPYWLFVPASARGGTPQALLLYKGGSNRKARPTYNPRADEWVVDTTLTNGGRPIDFDLGATISTARATFPHFALFVPAVANAGGDPDALSRQPTRAQRMHDGAFYWALGRATDLAALEAVSQRYAMDAKRVIATGFSYGGAHATHLVCAHPELFAGVVVCAGGVWSANHCTYAYDALTPWGERWTLLDRRLIEAATTTDAQDRIAQRAWITRVRDVPVYWSHGTLDRTSPYDAYAGPPATNGANDMLTSQFSAAGYPFTLFESNDDPIIPPSTRRVYHRYDGVAHDLVRPFWDTRNTNLWNWIAARSR